MNDRAASVLENYEIEVLRTWKGRGAILCESDKGLLILKEYAGSKDKVIFQDALLQWIGKQGFLAVESILRTKDGELIVYDQDRTPYILKTYFDGKECNLRDAKECLQAVKTLAKLHRASGMMLQEFPELNRKTESGIGKEYEKHNRELRKVRKFLKDKSQKTNFEIYLLKNYDYFFHTALRIEEEVRANAAKAEETGQEGSGIICHGDYQHHNIIVGNYGGSGKDGMAVINFEKCVKDSPVRDLYLFMRKLLEKTVGRRNWEQCC